MFKILISLIFLMGNAFGEFNISNIKLTPTELEIVGDSLEDIKSVTIISKDSSKEFEIENVSSNQVIARSLEDTTMVEGLTLNLVISDSLKESTYPITISQKNGLVTFYKLQEKESDYKPAVNSQNKMVLDQINFSPGDNNTGYDYNYSIYGNPTGDFAIKGIDKDLFTIDNEGNVEISGTLKIKGKPVSFNVPYLPIKEVEIPSNSANKVVFSAGASKELVESGYTIPMNICPKGQILKSDGVNFVCSLEASQEEQLGPVYTNNKSNLGIDQINRELQINNVVIGADNSITGVTDMDVATGTFHVTAATSRVGIGIAAPTVKLDIIGAANSGIHLKQGAQSTATAGAFRNGIVFEDSASNDSVAIGYGVGDLFSFIAFDGAAYRTVFSINGTGNGVILGNLKIGAYTLPATDGTTGTVLSTNGAGAVSWATVAGGTVSGPATTTVGNIATWNNGTGTVLADGGKLASNLVTNAGAGTPGFVATFGASGTVIQNGTKLETDLVTGPASASATDNLASFNNTNGKVIKDSGILSTNVMTMSVPAVSVVAGGNVLGSVLGTKSGYETLVPIGNLATMGTASPKQDTLILSAGTDKTQKATAFSIPFTVCTNGQVWKSNGTDMTCQPGGGAGDVVGPATSGSDTVAVFADTTGKLLKSVTLNYLNIVTAPTGDFTAANRVALTGGGAGKTIIETLYSFPTAIGTANQILKTNGAGVVTWQDDAAPSTNTVINQGTSTDNAIPRFVLATGKEIENSVVTIGNAGELAGVLSINGKTAADLLTVNATPTSDDRILLSTSGTKIMKVSPYTMPATCGANQILKADATGLIITCVADSGGVASVFNRTGAVVAVAGDYNASQVNSTPTGFVAAANVQAAITELDTEKLALAGGTMTGTLIITPAVQPAITLNPFGAAASELRFVEGGGSEYVGFKATGNVTANTIWTLPPADGASNTVLSTDGAGILSWKAVSGGDVTGPASSTDNAIARFDSTTGKIIQNSVVTIDDAGVMSGLTQMTTGGTFTITGDMTVTGDLQAQSYTNTSDRNLKKDIAPFSGGGDLIDKLMPVTFRWKKGDDRPVIGLIAQDVEKVLPDVVKVTKGKDGTIRSYDVGQVLALTIEALKETRAEVKKLQEKIKKLEQKKR